MTDDLARTFAMGVIATLLVFELVVAAKTWIETQQVRRPQYGWRPVLISRPFAIRAHFDARRRAISAMRWQYPILRSDRHGHQLRSAIRELQGAHRSETTACASCRSSRLHGLSRCPGCQRPLVEPLHPASA